MRELNGLYRDIGALHEQDCVPAGFSWIDCNDVDSGIISFLRRGRDPKRAVVVVCNFSAVPHQNRRVGVPFAGYWREVMNTDATVYGGSGWGNLGGVEAAPVPAHGLRCSMMVTAPPLSVCFFEGHDES